MSALEEKLMNWSQQQLNIKMQSKDSLNFLRSKNGNTFKKLLNFMSDRIKSKENGEQIKRFCDSIKCRNNLKTIEEEIKDIKSKISDIRTNLLAEEFNRKGTEIKDNFNKNKEFVSTLSLNAIEKISAKNKLCTQLKPNLKIIKEIITSYENLFTTNEEFDSLFDKSSDETVGQNKVVLTHILEQINQLMADIEVILFELNHLEVNKPINMNIDFESVSKCLVESNQINIKLSEEKKNSKSAITSKLVSAKNLLNKYQTIRLDKLSKNKEKLNRVINSCDEFIKQNA